MKQKLGDYVEMEAIIKQIENDPKFRLISTPRQEELCGNFTNLAKPGKRTGPFWDKRIRQALSYATNRQLIIDKLYFGHATKAPATCFVPGSPQWNPSLPTSIPHDIEKDRSFLKEAGYPNGLNKLDGVRDEIDTEEWEAIGCRHVNAVPAAEYLKPKK